MRFAASLTALSALSAQPASAADIWFLIVGDVPVTTSILYGSAPFTWPDRCQGMEYCLPEIGQRTEHVYWGSVGATTIDEINYTFHTFHVETREGISGSLHYLGNGRYRGVSLTYVLSPLVVGDGPWETAEGTTSIFRVFQQFPVPVPEPAAWALMLLGFGFVGSALRSVEKEGQRV